MKAVAGNIVVGYDASEHSREAVRHACALVETGAIVTIVHSYELPFRAANLPFLEDFRRVCNDVARELLDSARECVAECDAEVRYEVMLGKPADALTSLARDVDASLVVVGARGMGRVRAAIGSVTQRVIYQSPCPVFVVPDASLKK
jgi:nucleotide-binding universal stress UspA family protein